MRTVGNLTSLKGTVCVYMASKPLGELFLKNASFTISQSLLKLMSIESVMLSNHLILCRPLLFLLSLFPSIRILSSESTFHIGW